MLSSGLKVFPEDVELVAAQYPVLGSVRIVGVRRGGGEEVVAVVTSDRSDDEVARAIADVNAQVSSFQHISDWRRWPETRFPLTRLLKIDRRKVQEWANEASPEGEREPERVGEGDPLVDLIRRTLDDPKREVRDSDRLADLGLDSLRRLTVIALMEEEHGITIEEAAVTKTTTVAELRELAAAGSPAEPVIPRPAWPYRRGVRLAGDAARDVVIGALVGLWFNLRVEGRENLDGLRTPAFYIFNHSDDFDGPVVYRSVPRRVRKHLAVAAAADVMKEHKVLAFIIRLCFAAFGLARSEPYMPSLEYIGTLVDEGWSIVVAPEGRLSTNGVLQPFKSGIGMLAVNLGLPVVPLKIVGLFGTVPVHSKWPKRHSNVTVRIGRPMTFDPEMNFENVTGELHQALADL